MDSNIYTFVKTKSDIDLLVREIDILIDSLYRTGEADFDHTLQTRVRQDTAAFLKSKKQELPLLGAPGRGVWSGYADG